MEAMQRTGRKAVSYSVLYEKAPEGGYVAFVSPRRIMVADADFERASALISGLQETVPGLGGDSGFRAGWVVAVVAAVAIILAVLFVWTG